MNIYTVTWKNNKSNNNNNIISRYVTKECMTNQSINYSCQIQFKTKAFMNAHKLCMQAVAEHNIILIPLAHTHNWAG